MAFKDVVLLRRAVELDELLHRKERVNATLLAKMWEISPKAIQRLVAFLKREHDAPIKYDSKRQTYYYTDENYRTPWNPIDGRDLFAIAVAQKVLQLYEGTPVFEDLAAVYERLGELMPRQVYIRPSSMLERLYIHPLPLRLVSREVWSEVSQSLLVHAVLEMLYQKPGHEPEWRELEPFSLVLAASDWLVVGRDPADEKVKTFYLSRIHEVRRTKKIYFIPKTFDIRKHLGDSIGVYAGGKPFRFRVWFSRDVAPRIAEVRWHPGQQIDHIEGGELELELPAAHMLEAKRFVLSYGQHARAISPPELVEAIEKEAESVVLLYRK
jgi:predicted DNA-binding transcriptional regulator YafY